MLSALFVYLSRCIVFPSAASLQGVLAYDEKAYIAAKNDVATALSVLDAHLLKNSFMVGNGVTIADISIACALFGMYKEVHTHTLTATDAHAHTQANDAHGTARRTIHSTVQRLDGEGPARPARGIVIVEEE
jgi:glutathione S-transferase